MEKVEELTPGEMVEQLSLADRVLRQGSNFAQMDFPSRNLYRNALEELSRGSAYAEDEVRRIAEQLELVTAKKKDSTGICFIGERKFRDFLGRYLPAQPGPIVSVDGQTVGEHQGLMYHTLGQRKGLGIGGMKDSSEDPWYVVDKDVANNVLVVAQGHDHPRLMSVGLIAQQLHWVDRLPLSGPFRCTVKTRYRQQDIPCTVTPLDDERIEVHFDEPVSAVTPGQSAVFYQGEICLGGGIIEQRLA